jgi:hypothetical protein
MTRQIAGFEFLVVDSFGQRWVRLWGAGGLIGDGTLALLNAPGRPRNLTVERVEATALRRARAELRRQGTLRMFSGWDKAPDDRVVEIKPRDVLAARAMR